MIEEDMVELARELEARAQEKGIQLILPVDVVIADSFTETAGVSEVGVHEIPKEWYGLDIGPQSIVNIEKAIQGCGTLIWNGPMGVSEWPAFAKGTKGVAEAVAAATDQGCQTIVGGGDTVSAIKKFKVLAPSQLPLPPP
jgi:phosphoglycerate kinase